MKVVNKLWVVALALVMVFSLAACQGDSDTAASPDGETDAAAESQAPADDAGDADEPVTIHFFSNLPDRSSGMGELEQILIDQYTAENPHVTVEVEALQDEPYKQKFQSYVAGNELPDLCMVWGQPSFFQAVMEGGYVAELNPDDYTDYGFFDGATADFSYDGKLYGLPRNQDLTALFYNQAIFDEYDVKVPETYDDLMAAAETFRENGVTPLSINGKDKWILNLFFQDLLVKVSGDQDTIYDAIDQETSFAGDPDIRKTAELYKDLVDAGLFQDSYISADYASAMNLFLQEESAMFYMGAWEVGMASNEENSEHFRENVQVMTFPTVTEGEGKATDLVAWNGGGFAVSASSAVKDEAIALLNYMMLPDHWAKIGWETGNVVPGQDYSSFLTGNENQLQMTITDILQQSTSMSGTTWNDYAPGEWKTNCEQLMQEYSAGIVDIDGFLTGLDEAVGQ